MRTRTFQQFRPMTPKRESGVALILVLLTMLVLSVLAATIVFTARSETFASTNFRLDTQADYLAKAGVQKAVNWFRSAEYQSIGQNANPPVGQLLPAYTVATNTPNYYNVSASGTPFNLLTSNTSPVNCIAATPTCPSSGTQVQLIGYGGGSSNYPNISNAGGTAVATAFANDLNAGSGPTSNSRVTGDATDSGYFNVNAILLSYQTVNVNPLPPLIPPPYVVTPVETWLITSQAYWTGPPGSTATSATAEELMVIQPIFSSTWGNALYGFCSVTMSGSAGTCTDAFNSALGAYAAGNVSVAAGACDQTTVANVLSSGAGVGANGGVTLGSNVTVAGNVTIGSGPPSGCAASGYSGSTSSVLGEVVNGPHKNPPPVPTFPAGFPGTAPSPPLGTGSTVIYPTTDTWPNFGPTSPPPIVTWPNSDGYSSTTSTGPCGGGTCNGTQSNPFQINTISMTGGGKGGAAPVLQLIGGPDILHPVYYDIASLSQTQGTIEVSGYVVLNVQTSLSIGGNGISNSITSSVPPEAVQINYAGTNPVTINGNGAVSAILNAPNATVTLGGGGSAGYFVGAVQALNVSVMGGYPVHYDVQLSKVGGSLGTVIATAYGRRKM